MEDFDKRIAKLREMIESSQRIVFFGGAGVSTESGVKDYRSEDGIYNAVKDYGVPPEKILSRSFFKAHTDVFYDFYYKYFLSASPKPNAAHLALAKLEQIGKLEAVITQNIDGLHQAAGSRKVLELHGTTSSYHCVKCGACYGRETAAAAKGKIPRCTCGGVLKPDVVLYEEPLGQATLQAAVNAVVGSDLMIVGGTSLTVYPAAGLLRYFEGDNIVLINRTETPWDGSAKLIFREKIGEVLKSATENM